MSEAPERTRQLIDLAIDGLATEAEMVELEARLSQNASARKEYLDRIALDVMLHLEFESADDPGKSKYPIASAGDLGQQANRRSRFTWGLGVTAVLAAAASLFVMASLLWPPDSQQTIASGSNARPEDFVPQRKNEAEANATGFAVVTGQADALWSGVAENMTVGALLPAGDVSLDAGTVELELFSGVSVVVEGPAEFSLVSPMRMHVLSGRVRAVVPEAAQGFILSTREGDVVDLGTEFAVSVTGERCDLHVIEGEVELPKTQRLLQAGQAARLSDGNAIDEFPAVEKDFMSKSQLAARIVELRANRLSQWTRWQAELKNDPRLLVQYLCDAPQVQQRKLVAAGRLSSNAAIVAAAPAANRWGQAAAAIDFSPTGSRARLSIPGEHSSLTFVAWVRIHSLDRWYNSLFLTDGHDLQEPHWQIMDDGRIFFSVKKRDEFDRSKGQRDKHIYYSPPFWNAQLSGQWIMLATTYDPEARRVRHYLNGKMLSDEAIPPEYLVETVSIGAASIGNWGQPERDDPSFAIRNLNGSLDEFVIFSAALSAVEIKDMYLNGRP